MNTSINTLIAFVLLLFVAAGCGSSGSTINKPHEHIEFPPLKTVTLPDIERFSHNGIEFFLLHDDELPLIS
ncbi:hypothetical protein QLX67_14225, partial [Balneolaceae bacterium ANBcel3]|nr:hypothetical protein [Balneolaceae bacterium ANBcel3]